MNGDFCHYLVFNYIRNMALQYFLWVTTMHIVYLTTFKSASVVKNNLRFDKD